MGKFASKLCLPAIVSLILPSLAWAAGLGKLSVLSTLGQPLKAEIEIVSLQKGEGDTLGARLAPGEVFRQANIDLNPALMSVKFAVQRRPSGQYVMTLTSGAPINEPFIDVLVELNWANGRLVREYTFLLDLPNTPDRPSSSRFEPRSCRRPSCLNRLRRRQQLSRLRRLSPLHWYHSGSPRRTPRPQNRLRPLKQRQRGPERRRRKQPGNRRRRRKWRCCRQR